jgi:hypothetical protein
MRKRILLLSITAAGIAGTAAFGWMAIRRGFSARDNPSVSTKHPLVRDVTIWATMVYLRRIHLSI